MKKKKDLPSLYDLRGIMATDDPPVTYHHKCPRCGLEFTNVVRDEEYCCVCIVREIRERYIGGQEENIMNDNACLCIGGVLDGQFRKECGIRLKAIKLVPVAPPNDGPSDSVQMSYDIYRLELFRGERHRYPLYVLNSLSIDEAIEMLISNYRRPN